MDECTFINIQKRVYELTTCSKEIRLKLIEREDILHLDMIEGLRIDGWIRELNYLISETNFCLTYAKSYDYILKDNKSIGLIEVQRNIYIKIVLNNLVSFMDKMSFFIYELLGIELKEELYDFLDMGKLKNYVDKNTPDIISDRAIVKKEGIESIKRCINLFIKIKAYNKHIFDYRNRNNHRWNIGIDSFGSGVVKRVTKGESTIIKPANDFISFDELTKEVEKIIQDYNRIIEIINDNIK